MTETLSRGPSGNPDFSDQLAALMRGAGKEHTPLDSPEDIAVDTNSVDADEPSPIYDELMAEQNESVVESDASTSNVDRSASRIGNLLRGSGDLADSASEKLSDTKERAKSTLRGFGRAALRVARASRELGAGAKVLATQTAKNGAEAVTSKVTETYNGAVDKGMESLDKGADYVGDKMVEAKNAVKEKLIAKMNAAKARRQARREKWSQRWTGAKESVKSRYDKAGDSLMNGFAKAEAGMDVVGQKMVNAKDKASDKVERTRSTLAATRAIGRAAIDARR
jgi:hypothetical protein